MRRGNSEIGRLGFLRPKLKPMILNPGTPPEIFKSIVIAYGVDVVDAWVVVCIGQVGPRDELVDIYCLFLVMF